MIDDIDAKILKILQDNSRTTNAEIARQVNMAPSAVFERIRRLEKKKVIRKYSVDIEPVEVGKGLLAFIEVKANGPVVDQKTAKEISEITEVQEVHIVAGEDCYLVKVRVENTKALTQLLRTKFAAISSVRTTNTTIVLETVKETSELDF
jgi:Lrp/AsnC family leucine-responsive transcriptional regulator